jgi:hypothetical protein
VIDLRWQMVVCVDCNKRYRCTPSTDYYARPGTLPSQRTAANGRCWDCHLSANGMQPQPEPQLGDDEYR